MNSCSQTAQYTKNCTSFCFCVRRRKIEYFQGCITCFFFFLCKSWRVRPPYNLLNQMFFHIISDGWNVQMFHHHLILSKPLSRVSPDLLICYVLPCLKLWLIFVILNPFHRVTFFNSMSLIIVPMPFWFQFLYVWSSGVFFFFSYLEGMLGMVSYFRMNLTFIGK